MGCDIKNRGGEGGGDISFHGVNMGQHDLSDIWGWDILAAITPGVLDNSDPGHQYSLGGVCCGSGLMS